MSLVGASISADIARNVVAGEQPTTGIKQRILVLNSATWASATDDATNPESLVTGITTNAGTSGFILEGILNKDWIQRNSTSLNSDDSTPGFNHGITGIRILSPTQEVRAQVMRMHQSGDVFRIITEDEYTVTDKNDAFKLHGQKYGLIIPDGGLIDNSAENDGSMVLSFQSFRKEPYGPKSVVIGGSYANTSLAIWTNKLPGS